MSWLNSYSPDRSQVSGMSHKLWPHGFMCLNSTNKVCAVSSAVTTCWTRNAVSLLTGQQTVLWTICCIVKMHWLDSRYCHMNCQTADCSRVSWLLEMGRLQTPDSWRQICPTSCSVRYTLLHACYLWWFCVGDYDVCSVYYHIKVLMSVKI